MKITSSIIRHATARNRVVTDLGPVTLLWNDGSSLCTGILLPESPVHRALPPVPLRPLPELLFPLERAVRDCARGLWRPADLSLLFRDGVSDFQWRVLMADYSIPSGKAATYGMVAEQAGYPGAARAAGGSLAGNPWPLVIPCHRVIRSDRRPGGFQSGTSSKLKLLALEGVVPGADGRIPSGYLYEFSR